MQPSRSCYLTGIDVVEDFLSFFGATYKGQKKKKKSRHLTQNKQIKKTTGRDYFKKELQ